MFINILVVLVVLGLGALWMARGFFSALIHLVCVVIAGALAFALWEPISYMLLTKAPDSKLIQGSAWAIGLGIPFAALLAIFRLILDKVLGSNVAVHTATNYVGGFACGALSGLITAGILVLSLGFLRMDHDLFGSDSMGGYKPAVYEGNGSIVRGEGLWIPADKLTADFYGLLSKTTLRTDENLATLYPDLDAVPATLRMNHGLGKGRNTTRPDDFKVEARYTVGEGSNLPPDQLMSDKWNASSQRVNAFDKGTFPPGTHLEGFVIKFNASAKEFGGDSKVTFGNAQVRLVARNKNDEEDVKTIFPVAAITQADPATPGVARFRFDSKEVFIAAVGGASDSYFGIEFPVPPGYEPYALYVKNVRVLVNEGKVATVPPNMKFADASARDAGVMAIAAGVSGGGGPVDTTTAQVVKNTPAPGNNPGFNDPATTGITISNQLPWTVNKMTVRTLEIGDGNLITGGEQAFSGDDKKNYPTDKDLRINGFASTSDTVIVQVDVSMGKKASWLGNAAAAAEDLLPPVLTDAAGTQYQPIGYIHDDGASGNTTVRFTPGQPVRALKEIPTLSRSKPNDKVILVFRVSAGVKLQSFGVGRKAILVWNPPVQVNAPLR